MRGSLAELGCSEDFLLGPTDLGILRGLSVPRTRGVILWVIQILYHLIHTRKAKFLELWYIRSGRIHIIDGRFRSLVGNSMVRYAMYGLVLGCRKPMTHLGFEVWVLNLGPYPLLHGLGLGFKCGPWFGTWYIMGHYLI